MTDSSNPEDKKPEEPEIPRLTPEEVALLKAAETRGTHIEDLDLHGVKYVIGSMSGAVQYKHAKECAKAAARVRKELEEELNVEAGLTKDAPCPFIVTNGEVNAIAAGIGNGIYAALSIRSINGDAVSYAEAQRFVDGLEAHRKAALIQKVSDFNKRYSALLDKLDENNVKK